MPSRGRLAAVAADAARTLGRAAGLTPHDRMMLVMIRRPEWLYRVSQGAKIAARTQARMIAAPNDASP